MYLFFMHCGSGLESHTLIIATGVSHGILTAGSLVAFCKWYLEERLVCQSISNLLYCYHLLFV